MQNYIRVMALAAVVAFTAPTQAQGVLEHCQAMLARALGWSETPVETPGPRKLVTGSVTSLRDRWEGLNSSIARYREIGGQLYWCWRKSLNASLKRYDRELAADLLEFDGPVLWRRGNELRLALNRGDLPYPIRERIYQALDDYRVFERSE